MDETPLRSAPASNPSAAVSVPGTWSGFGQAWSTVDWVVLAALVLMAAWLVESGVNWRWLPAEDALMLMRYAAHLAGGHGIVWNIGDPPVEGATDFLYLIVLAGWIKLSHFGPILASRTLLGTAHVAGVAVLYTAARRVAGSGRLLASTLALYLAVGSGIANAGNGFSSPFYGLMALVAWAFACASVVEGSSTKRSVGFACFALLAGLTRPDGVLLAVFMTYALVYALGRASARMVVVTVAIFAVFGGAYFLWRFHYFGHLLPNPFYKKGGGHLYFGALKYSIRNVIKMLLPFIPVFVLGLIVPRARRLTIFSLIPIVAFTCIWVLLSSENNGGMRFQYVTVPIALLSVALIVRELAQHLRDRGWILTDLRAPAWASVVIVLTLATSFFYGWRTLLPGQERLGTGSYEIAKALAPYSDRHYTLSATEAGVIPYFSGWRSIDGWGLNDADIAHNPHGATTEYYDLNHPAIIMLFSDLGGGKEDFDRTWRGDAPPAENMAFLQEQESHYSITHNYELAARWGTSPCSVNLWYVRRDLPEFKEFLAIIRKAPHFYPYNNAELAQNFLDPNPPASCIENNEVMTPRD